MEQLPRPPIAAARPGRKWYLSESKTTQFFRLACDLGHDPFAYPPLRMAILFQGDLVIELATACGGCY